MTFEYLLNNIDFEGGLLINVWDEDLEKYIINEADYDELDKADQLSLYPLTVARIYPFNYDIYAAVTVELLTH